jgi:predicted  nucleic acid-binding Zn-ribbon protein
MIDNIVQIRGAHDICSLTYSASNVLVISSSVKFTGNIVDMASEGTVSITGNIVLPRLYPNTIPFIDATGKLANTSVTPTELSMLRGIAGPIQSQLDAHSFGNAVISGATSNFITSNMTPNVVVITDSDGKVYPSAVTTTELQYLRGVSGNLQSQLDSKQTNLNYFVTGNLAPLNVVVTDSSGKLSNSSVSTTSLGFIGNLTGDAQFQLDAKAPTITGAASTVTSLDLSANALLITNSSGKIAASGVSSAKAAYLSDVTSSIQTQLDAKQTTLTGAASTVTSANLPSGIVLISSAGGKIAASETLATNLGSLAGVTTNIQDQLDAKQSTITGAASSIVTSDLGRDMVLVSDAGGKVTTGGATRVETAYLASVTGPIQTQLDGKEDILTGAASSVTRINLNPFSVPVTDAFGKFQNSGVSVDDLVDVVGARGNLQLQIDGKQSVITGAATLILDNDLAPNVVMITNASGKAYNSLVSVNELWTLNGIRTNIQTALDSTQGTITGAASSITTSNLPVEKVLVSDANGKVSNSSVTSSEVSFLVGLRSAAQTQIDAKQAIITGAASSITSADLSPGLVAVSSGSGKLVASDVTSAELALLSGGGTNSLSSLAGNVTGLQSNAAAQQSSLVLLQGNVAATQSGIGALQTRSTNLEANVATAQTGISTLQTRSTNLEANVSISQNGVTALQTRSTNLEANVATAQTGITALQTRSTNLEANVATAQTGITSLQTRSTNLESNVALAQNGITALQTRSTNLEANVSTAQTGITALQTRSTNLEANVATAQTGITSLQTRSTNLEANVALAQNGITALQTRSTNLEANVATAQTGITALQTRSTNLESNVALTQNGITALQTRSTNLESNVSAAQTGISALQSNVSTLQGNATTTASQVTALQSGLAGKQATLTGGITSFQSSNLRANIVVVSDASGKMANSVVSTAELACLTGATSNIQLQIDNLTLGGITGGASTVATVDLSPDIVVISNALGKIVASPVTAIELSRLRGISGNVETSLTNLAANTTATQTGISTLQTRSTNLEANVSITQTGIVNLQTRSTNLEANVATAQTGILALQANVATAQTGITALQTRSTNLEANVATAQTGITSLQTRSTNLESNVSTAQTGILALQANVATAQTGITSLQTRSTNLESNVATAQTGITALQTRSTNLEANVATAQTGILALQANVSTAQTGISTLQTRSTNLEANVSAAQTGISTLQTRSTNLESNVSTAQTGILALQANVSTAQTGISTLQTRSTNLEANVSAAQTGISTLQTRSTNLEANVATTQTGITALQTRSTNLEANVAAAQTQIATKQNLITGSTDLTAGTLTIGSSSSTAMTGQYVYLARSADGGALTGSSAVTPLGIGISAVNGSIQAAQFVAVSDARIKKHAALENTMKLAECVYALPVKTWRYVDDVAKGSRERLGFIAQDVRNAGRIGEYAVSTHSDFLPTIYERASVGIDGRVALQKPHGFCVGDRVRYFTLSESLEARVTRIVSNTEFYLDGSPGLDRVTEIFVYGPFASDVLSIDYDAIVAGLVATVQDQNRRLRALESQLIPGAEREM